MIRIVMGILVGSAFCQSMLAADLPQIMLWPNGMPEPKVLTDPPESVELGKDGISRRSNVSQPRLFVHLPSHAQLPQPGAAMIVVPGGGFGRLADGHEGFEACEWLAKQGITTFLLVHRTPTNMHAEPFAGPVQDLQKAIIDVRLNAQKWNVDPQKIGVLGFSAGGQVAIIAATNKPTFELEPDRSSVSASPNILLLLYPYQIYDAERKALRKEIRVEGELPPSFIAQMGDDSASLPQGSTLLYLELINRKVPAELHIYENGGHGFGMRPRPDATGPTDWQLRAIDWLKRHGYSSDSN